MMETMLIFFAIVLTAMAGYLIKSLTRSGAFFAAMLGLVIYLGFGISGLFLLGVFFSTSSIWSKYKSSLKSSIEEKLAKGAIRDWRQVLANGGAAGIFSILYSFQHDPIWLLGFAVSLASANSDTWASEIGPLSKKNPIYIRTFKRIERGTSGAMSLLGTLGALAGSLLIALISFWLFQIDLLFCFLIFLFGFIGNLIDTLIGAFYQLEYHCNYCGIDTEKKIHCHFPTTRMKGSKFIDNDMVNFLSGFFAALLAMVFVKIYL